MKSESRKVITVELEENEAVALRFGMEHILKIMHEADRPKQYIKALEGFIAELHGQGIE